MDSIEKMSKDDKNSLLQFLASTGYTGVFEILSPEYKHVEDLSSLRVRNGIYYIDTDRSRTPSKDDKYLATVPPHIGIEIAKALGLLPFKYDVLPITELDIRMKQIRQGYQHEGDVLYLLDNNGFVLGLLKKKLYGIVCVEQSEKSYELHVNRVVLTHWKNGQFPGGPTSIGTYANLCMLRTACFLMFKH
jgi:hypothetical protein